MKDTIANICFALLVVIGLSVISYMKMQIDDLKMENRGLRVDLAHAQVPLKRDTIRDSIPVVRYKTNIVDRTDYKRQIADKQLIHDLQLRLSQIEMENQQLTSTAGQVKLDSAITDSTLEYHDKWADFVYTVPSKELDYKVRDSVTMYISRIYAHRILWFRWGTKGYEVEHVSHNPNSTLECAKIVIVK